MSQATEERRESAELEDEASRGVPWMMLAYIANKTLTMGSTLVLARLLAPSDYGVMALAFIVVGALTYMSDFGLGNTLVARPDLDRRAQGTVLTLLGTTGASFALLGVVAAPLAAALLSEPRLGTILPVLAPTLALFGVASFYEKLLQRELGFKRIFAANLTQSGLYSVVSITLALSGADIWSLVIGHVVGVTAFFLVVVISAPHRVRPTLDRAAARDIVSTSTGFLLQGSAWFAQENLDNLIVGRALGAGPLGLYNMSYRLSEIPYLAVSDPMARTTFPAFSRMRKAGQDVRAPFLANLRLVALIACPLGVVLSGAAPAFVHTVLGPRWEPMIGALTILGLWGAFRPINNTLAWLLNSLGHQRTIGRVTLGQLVLMAPLMVVGTHVAGILGVACVVLGRVVLMTAVIVGLAVRRAEVPSRDLLRALGPVIVACAGCFVSARVAVEATSSAAPLVSLVTSVALSLVVYFGLLTAVEPGSLRRARSEVARMIGRPRATPEAHPA